MSLSRRASNANCFLFVAHPGHELCVHGWLSHTQPKVFVLTDGSGHRKQSRIDSTSRVLARAGARAGSIYGRFTDPELYELILSRNFQPLLRVVDEFAAAIVTDDVSAVVGDAIEGYNPSHDTCRLMVNAAVSIARRSSGREILNHDFLLAGRHLVGDDCRSIHLELDDSAFTRKLEAAREFPELQPEIQAALAGELLAVREYPQLTGSWTNSDPGSKAYRTEVLRPVTENGHNEVSFNEPPFYERYGELRVAAGYYRSVIRHREHMLPLAEALTNHAQA